MDGFKLYPLIFIRFSSNHFVLSTPNKSLFLQLYRRTAKMTLLLVASDTSEEIYVYVITVRRKLTCHVCTSRNAKANVNIQFQCEDPLLF